LKFLLTLIVPVVASCAAAQPAVPECFKVHSLIRMDEDHYWANWTNACPYTIDSVYVMVKFSGRSSTAGSRSEADGVWALHFVTPGTHQVTRLNTPLGVADYDAVRVHKITTDSTEALHVEPIPTHLAARDPNRVADPGPSVPPAPELTQATLSYSIPASSLPPATTTPPVTNVPRSEKLPEVNSGGPAVVPQETRPASHFDSTSTAKQHELRGRELLTKGKYREAVAELSQAIGQKPDYALAYNARGYAYYQLRQYPSALADLDEAIRLNPRYLNAYQNRSRARKAAGDSSGSVADGKKARELAKVTTE
jgi:hypothetical protein